MKTKLSCEASFKWEELKMRKPSFRARPPSNCNSWRYEIPRVKDAKTKPSCEVVAFRFQHVRMWTHIFDTALPMHKVPQHMQTTTGQHHERREEDTWNHQFLYARISKQIRPTSKRRCPQASRKRAYFPPQRKLRLPKKTRCVVQILTNKSHPKFEGTKLSGEASFKCQELKIRKQSFRARHPSNSKSSRCENEAFVRGASLKFHKGKIWFSEVGTRGSQPGVRTPGSQPGNQRLPLQGLVSRS